MRRWVRVEVGVVDMMWPWVLMMILIVAVQYVQIEQG